jgi:hypothetical protein
VLITLSLPVVAAVLQIWQVVVAQEDLELEQV